VPASGLGHHEHNDGDEQQQDESRRSPRACTRVGRRPTDELDMLYFLSLKLITLNARMTTTSEARLPTLGGLRQARNPTSVATADGTHHRPPGCTPWAERCMLASSN